MKICPSCRSEYSDDIKFCRRDGSKLVPKSTQSPEVLAKCESYREGIAKAPEDDMLVIEFGDYLASIGLSDDALEQWRNALTSKSEDVARRKIIDTLKATEQWDNAATHLLHLIDQQPDDMAIQFELLDAYLAGDRVEEAVDRITKLADMDPTNAEILRRWRDLTKRQGDSDALLDVCHRLIELEPHDAPTWELIAETLRAEGKIDEATRAHERLLAVEPQSAIANLHLAFASLRNAHPDDTDAAHSAQAMLSIALSKSDELSSEHRLLAHALMRTAQIRTGDCQSPEGLGKKISQRIDAILETEYFADALLLLGAAERAVANWDEAIAAHTAAVKLTNSSAAQMALAECQAAHGDHLLRQCNFKGALAQSEAAFKNSGGKLDLKNQIKRAKQGKSRKRSRVELVVLLAVITVAVITLRDPIMRHLMTGSVQIEASVTAQIDIIQDGQVVLQSQARRYTAGALPSGTYVVRASRDGYDTVEETVRVPLFQRVVNVDLTLNPTPESQSAAAPSAVETPRATRTGSLVVDSHPQGAEVIIDGRVMGGTPLQIDDLAPRTLTVTLRLADSNETQRQAIIRAGAVTNLGTISLQPASTIDTTLFAAEGARTWGSGFTVVDHQGQRFLTSTSRQAEDLTTAVLPLEITGDFSMQFDIVESGGTPEFQILFIETDGTLSGEITLQEDDHRWHVWMEVGSYDRVPFEDDGAPDTFTINRVGNHWAVMINSQEVVQSDNMGEGDIREVHIEVPVAGRVFYLGDVSVRGL